MCIDIHFLNFIWGYFSHVHYVHYIPIKGFPDYYSCFTTWKVIRFQTLFVIFSDHLGTIPSSKSPRISEILQIDSWHLRKTICLANTELEKSLLLSIHPSRVPLLLNIICQSQVVSVVLIIFWSCWSLNIHSLLIKFLVSDWAQVLSLLGSICVSSSWN